MGGFRATLTVTTLFLCLSCSDLSVNLQIPEGQPEPHSFFISWQQDPTTTMTIDWHTDPDVESVVQFRRLGDTGWRGVAGRPSEFPRSERIINRVELTGLAPDQVYEFRFTEQTEPYRFRTMPARATRPVLFATGGDLFRDRMAGINRLVVQHDVDFVALGGDLAYSFSADRWYDYLETWTETMIRDDRRVIPHMSAIGNHEVRQAMYYNYDEYEQTDAFRQTEAPFFYSLFAFPGQPGFNVLDFGDYLSLIFLDTDHTNPVEGLQSVWLNQSLQRRQDGRHIMPIYHVPAWPSARSPEGRTERQIRESWVPMFERFGVRVAFENHDHSYKRTYPLLNGRIDHDGIVYMGDGAWGAPLRDVHEEWYLEQASRTRHFVLVELNGGEIDIQAISGGGTVFDQTTLSSVPQELRTRRGGLRKARSTGAVVAGPVTVRLHDQLVLEPDVVFVRRGYPAQAPLEAGWSRSCRQSSAPGWVDADPAATSRDLE